MIKEHIKSLDGIRGLAAFWVFMVHIMYADLLWKDFPFNHNHNMGALGVSVFFALSGFLIGFLYIGKPFKIVNINKYLISRFSRIAPAYLFIVLISIFFSNFIDGKFVYSITGIVPILRHLLFSGNVDALWSIPPEVQFYLFFVLIWYATSVVNLNNNWLIVSFLIIILMIVGYLPKGTLLIHHIHLFVFGVFAGCLRKKVGLKENLILTFIQLAAVFSTFLYCAYLVKTYAYDKPYHVIDFAILVAFAVFVLSYSSLLTRNFFETKFFVWLGKVSFSLYLLNPIMVNYASRIIAENPDIQKIVLTLLIPITLLLSYMMYLLIEMPAQKKIKDSLNG